MVSWLLVLLLAAFQVPVQPEDPDALRQELLLRLNEERARLGAPPLLLIPTLSRVAQERAERVGSRREDSRSSKPVQQRLALAGYRAHDWDESYAVSAGGPDEVFEEWRRKNPQSKGKLPSFRQVGIGISEYRGYPFYVFFFAWSEGDYFAQRTERLRDLGRVRADMLARVNRVRGSRGLGALRPCPELDQAAQEHAWDLLRHAYFDHTSPDGTTQDLRAVAAGYPSSRVSENLHRDRYSVDDVVQGWQESERHNTNLLNPAATDLGVGLALGAGYGLDERDYRVIWVLDFGER